MNPFLDVLAIGYDRKLTTTTPRRGDVLFDGQQSIVRSQYTTTKRGTTFASKEATEVGRLVEPMRVPDSI
ncbi:MAG: hypothetical protein C4326_07685 [Ignavibacteria bacterium]